ncbi:MAG: hypothetical protein OIF35_08230 [Cellvibrionaceae bacterium]|nr:hypothetical protein [Cellvibrionaceae bacterium]
MTAHSGALITLAISGCSDDTLKPLRFYFQKFASAEFQLASADSAQLHLIDIDSPAGRTELENAQRRGQQLICLSFDQQGPGGSLMLSKPFAHHKLAEVLKQAAAQLRRAAPPKPQLATPAAAVVAKPKINWQPETYEPANYLQGLVAAAMTKSSEFGSAVSFTVDAINFVVCIEQNLIWYCCKPAKLRELASAELADPKAAIKLVVADTDESEGEALDSFLWKVSSWAARGRVPSNVDLNQSISLKYWPNLPQIMRLPECARLCAILSQAPRSLSQLVEQDQINPDCVANFYSSASVLDLLQLSVDSGQQPRLSEHRQVLGKLLKKIKPYTHNHQQIH